MKRILEKRREVNRETHIAFIDFEKAFDNVDRCKLWTIMKNNGYPPHLIEVVKSLYKETKVIINTGKSKTEELKTNKGVKQGCSLSPTLFNIYIDDLLKRWKNEVEPGILIGPNKYLNMLMYADNIAIIQQTENELQRSVYKLNEIAGEYNMKISLKKSKIMAHHGKFPTRSKIVIDNKLIERTNHFNYLGCDITYDRDKDIENKINKFQSICGTINRTLQNKTRKDTKLKFYKVMAVPVLMYGSESWILKEADKNKIQAAEMRFLRKVKGCSRRDHIRNETIREELEIFNINERINDYKEKWKNHINRMDSTRIPHLIHKYQPRGRRDVGRPRKRWS